MNWLKRRNHWGVMCLYVVIPILILRRLKLIYIRHKGSVCTSQRTHHTGIRKISRRVLCRKTVAVYCDSRTKYTMKLADEMQSFRRVRKVAKSACYLRLVRPSVRPSIHPSIRLSIHAFIHPSIHTSSHLLGTTRLTLGDGFSWNLISFTKICRENWGLVKVGQITRRFTWRPMFIGLLGHWRGRWLPCYHSCQCLCVCYGHADAPEVFLTCSSPTVICFRPIVQETRLLCCKLKYQLFLLTVFRTVVEHSWNICREEYF
jgi:hypothetical protein